MTLADLLARVLEAPIAVADAPVEARDAIVVLGAPLANDALTPWLEERVDAATMLYRAGAAPRVVTTGGVTRGARRSEADALADGLVAAGVAREHVVVEGTSQTTAENARFTAALLPPGARVWLVTQPFHARRAARLFRAAGLDARAWHIAGSVQYRDRARAVRWLVREYAAWGRMLLRGDR
jgi:uncharacterized SAM-binding protein YcdF (DUF218 family)